MTLDAFLAWQEIRLKRQLYSATHREPLRVATRRRASRPTLASAYYDSMLPEDQLQARIENARRVREQRAAAKDARLADMRQSIDENWSCVRARRAADADKMRGAYARRKGGSA